MEEKKTCERDVVMVADIGGSKYMPGFVDRAGNILYQERREWTEETPDAIVRQLKEAFHEIRAKCPDIAAQAKAGGLTIPGFADPVTGVWVDSDFLKVQNLPICSLLEEEFGIPFFADNDGNACALAEKYFGGAKDEDDFLYMTVSTGIGGALYVDGELYYGAFQHSGEIGLFVVEEYGRPSDTGSVNGIVEMYASGRGFADNYIAAGGRPEIDGKTPGGPEISKLAEAGDPAALTALKLEGRYLGRIIANACAFVRLDKIILGGGLSLLFEKYRDALLEEFHRILPESGRGIRIEATSLGYSGAFLGAAAVGIRGLESVRDGKALNGVQESTLRLRIGDTVRAAFCPYGKEDGAKSTACGEFLVAGNIEDDGRALDEIAAEEDPERLGNGVGKAAACACVLLDPKTVVLEGDNVRDKAFQDSFLEAVVRETYYRGNLPFSIVYQS